MNIYLVEVEWYLDMDKNALGTRELEFVIFWIENVVAKLHIDVPKVYAALTEQSDILQAYIIPEYEVLHTQSKEYIVDDIITVMRNRIILPWRKL